MQNNCVAATARIIIVSCMFIGNAWSFGAEGHRITGVIAQQLLTPQARSEVSTLLNGTDLPTATTWMDRKKKVLGEAISHWHYDNTPVCDDGKLLPNVCAAGDCLSKRLPEQIAILSDPKQTKALRGQALLFVVHLLGDLHQPLHTADHHDRGGNQLTVIVSRGNQKEAENLHQYWDVKAVDAAMQGERVTPYAKRLLQRYQAHITDYAKGNVAGWENETFQLARSVTYNKLPDFSCKLTHDGDAFVLSNDYQAHAATTVEIQLMKAGVRMAAVLNAALVRD